MIEEKYNWSPVAAVEPEYANLVARLFAENYPSWAARCNGRVERAAQIMHSHGACQVTDQKHVYRVESQTRKNEWYYVNTDRKICTCPDSLDGNLCKHRLVVAFHLHGPDWIRERQKTRTQAIAAARAAEEQAWSLAIAAIDAWEDTGARNPNDPGLPELEARKNEAVSIAESLQARFNELI